MKTLFLCLFLATGACLAVQSDRNSDTYDTVSPNVFWFSSNEYVVTENETNLVITVQWTSGNRGYSGWVDYAVTNGTATPGSDYEVVSGRLYFSSPAPRTFTIPIHADALVEGEETIQLILSNPTAIIETSNAVVKIEDNVAPPPIAIGHAPNGSISLSWPGQTSEFVLESSASPNGSWTEVSSTPAQINGRCCVNQPGDVTAGFFRLRRKSF